MFFSRDETVDLGWVRLTLAHHGPGLRSPEHDHPFACVHLPLAGLYVEQSCGKLALVGPGAALVKGPGCPHRNRMGAAAAQSMRLEFPGDAPNLPGTHAGRWQQEAVVGAPCRHATEELARALDGGAPPAELERLAQRVIAAWDEVDDAPEVRAAQRIARDPCAPHGIAALSRELGVHRSHLTRRFGARFGTTLAAYRTARRVAWVASRLLEGDAPLAELALAAGFADQSHCTRAFGATMGMPPRAWTRG